MIDTDRIWTWLTIERKWAIGVDDGWCDFEVLRIGDGLHLTTPIQKYQQEQVVYIFRFKILVTKY